MRARLTTSEPNYYQVLGVSSRATSEEIRKSFRRLVLQAHPDKNPKRREWSERRVRELVQAFEVVGNTHKRAAYDRRQLDALSAGRRGEQPFFFRKRDPESRALLVLYLLLNGRQKAATVLLEQMEHEFGAEFLAKNLDRSDYLDCLFLIAEQYTRERRYGLAACRLLALYLHDRFAVSPRQYLGEVVRLLKDLYLRKLPRSACVEEAIEGLKQAEALGLTRAEELLRLSRLTEVQAHAGMLAEARESLSRARRLDPSWKGLRRAEAAVAAASRKTD